MALYSPTLWVNNTAPPLSAANLNKLTTELRLQASAKGIGNSLPNWADGVAPALTDADPLNEMERVARAVAVSLSASYTPTAWQTGWQPGRNATNLNKLEQRAQANRALIEAPPPPSNRYTDVDFAAGSFAAEGWECIFAAYQSDPRLASTWGGQDAAPYDSLGMTQDMSQRVHLFHPTSVGLPANPNGTSWACWNELRTTDSYWCTNAGGDRLAKASVDSPTTGGRNWTWGSSGWGFGITRWFACDILFPLNIVGSTPAAPVSFEAFTSSWQTCFDMHDSGGTGAVPFDTGLYPGGGNNSYFIFRTTPDQSSGGVPYESTNLMLMWDGSGNRVASAFNTWHEVVIGIRATADNSGWYEVWFDGVQKAPQTNRQLVTASEGGPYIQIQNYSEYPTSYASGATRSAVVYGGVRCGMTRADVQKR